MAVKKPIKNQKTTTTGPRVRTNFVAETGLIPAKKAGLPDWAAAAFPWNTVDLTPPTIASYTPAPSNTATAPTPTSTSTQWITLDPSLFAATTAAQAKTDANAAWDKLVVTAGIDLLGVDTNWWPGVEIPNYDAMIAESPEAARLIPRESWRFPSQIVEYDDPTNGPGTDASAWVRYDPIRAAQQYLAMGGTQRATYASMMVDAGLLEEEWDGIGDFDPHAAAAFQQALAMANYYGKPVDQVLKEQATLYAKLKANQPGGGGGGGAGPTVKLEIPNYETLVADAKNLIRQKLGRDPQDWEMTMVADEMSRQYGKWADATKARMIGGNGTYEIPDPVKLSEEFVERKYSDELGRLDDINDTRSSNQILIAGATKGTQMMGGIGG